MRGVKVQEGRSINGSRVDVGPAGQQQHYHLPRPGLMNRRHAFVVGGDVQIGPEVEKNLASRNLVEPSRQVQQCPAVGAVGREG
jgi:hypothetical protein